MNLISPYVFAGIERNGLDLLLQVVGVEYNPDLHHRYIALEVNRDRSTVHHSINKVTDDIKLYNDTNEAYRAIKQRYNMLRTKGQNNRLFGAVGKLNMSKDQLAELVLETTEGRTSSSKEMEVGECQNLIFHLETLAQGLKAKDDPADKMRKKILSHAHELAWTRYDAMKNKTLVDYDHLNQWMLKFSYLHKPMNQYTLAELPQLVTQFSKVSFNQHPKAQ